jgi:antitoxin component YwqK of YwqJK toxin-antitoxin module
MKLINIFEQLLIENLLDTFIEKNVGDGKPISDEIFNEIKMVSKGKVNYILWLAKSYMNGVLHHTDIYKFGDEDNDIGYFTIFEKNKNKYPYKDLNQYKTAEDIEKFIGLTIKIREKDIDLSKSTQVSDNYVSIKDIKRLQEVNIDYMGISQGYQIFHIPNEAKDNDQAFSRYNEILGKCAGRDQGKKIDICTFKIEKFKDYLNKYPGSSYYLLYNLSDPQSPYQIHIESGQFMDRNNQNVEYDKWIESMDFIEKKTNTESGTFLYQLYGMKPIEDYMFDDYHQESGEMAENGEIVNYKLQGVWYEPDKKVWISQIKSDGYSLIKYENGIKNGPFLSFYPYREGGKLYEKSYYKNGKLDGESITYERNGDIKFIRTFKNGLADGKFLGYHENGNLLYKIFYKMGEKHGTSVYYYENGEIQEQEEWKNGRQDGVTKSYNRDGKLREYSTYKEDMLDGLYKYYYDNGTLQTERMYKDSRLHGTQNEYYNDGTLKSSKNYINSMLDGELKIFSQNGGLRRHVIYDNGTIVKVIVDQKF